MAIDSGDHNRRMITSYICRSNNECTTAFLVERTKKYSSTTKKNAARVGKILQGKKPQNFIGFTAFRQKYPSSLFHTEFFTILEEG